MHFTKEKRDPRMRFPVISRPKRVKKRDVNGDKSWRLYRWAHPLVSATQTVMQFPWVSQKSH